MSTGEVSTLPCSVEVDDADSSAVRGDGQLAVLQAKRGITEDILPPAPGGSYRGIVVERQRLEIVGRGDEARCDALFVCHMLEQYAQQLHHSGWGLWGAPLVLRFGKCAVRHRVNVAKEGQNGGGKLAVGAPRKVADLAEFDGGRGIGAGKVENRLIAQDPVPGKVA